MNVSLTPKLQQYVREKVQSGRYESASEVIRDSLRALQQRERGEQEFWRDARRKVAEARKDVATGRTVDGESAMAEIIAELEADKPQSRRRRRVNR
jgi:antitoxin ParD1/3/4